MFFFKKIHEKLDEILLARNRVNYGLEKILVKIEFLAERMDELDMGKLGDKLGSLEERLEDISVGINELSPKMDIHHQNVKKANEMILEMKGLIALTRAILPSTKQKKKERLKDIS